MILIAHNIRSLHNVGAVLRTADGAGVEKVFLTGITGSPLDRLGEVRKDIKKTALGAEKSVAWEERKNLTPLIRKLKGDGYHIYALEQSKASVPYTSIEAKKKSVVIVGNEVRGLSRAVLEKADTIIDIPMRGEKESLNVSVAAGIVMYHFTS